MYTLKRDVVPGTVVWGERKIYYDQPNKPLYGKKSMYLVTMINDDYFFGCPLKTKIPGNGSTVICKKNYPIKQDSAVDECLYKLEYSDIVNPSSFRVSSGTFDHFKRNLYRKIVLGMSNSPKEYNDLFMEEYLKNHTPRVDDVIVYPGEEKTLKYFYICDEDNDNYTLLPLKKDKICDESIYTITDNKLTSMSKSILCYDFYREHSLSRLKVDNALNKCEYQKKIGTII